MSLKSQSARTRWLSPLVVVTLLVWGSTLLINAISNLRITLGETSNIYNKSQLSLFKNANRYDSYNILNSKVLNFENIRNSTFQPKFKSIQWINEPNSFQNDKGTYTTNDNNTYLIKSMEDESFSQLLFNGSYFIKDNINYTIDSFKSSPDLKLALIQTNFTQHWRHSSFGLYWILDVELQTLTLLNEKKLSIAKWSPTSKKIAYVLENNVFTYDLTNGETLQSSFDGGENIFNGKPDWVYEEEVLESDTALWWSPNGEYLAYLKSNDSQVPEFPIPYFVYNDYNNSYPDLLKLKYPKAGYNNPIVNVVLFGNNQTEVIDYNEGIITEVVWVGDDNLLLKTTNRESDYLKVLLINAITKEFQIIRDEITDSWFEITHNTLFVPKSNTIENDGYIDTISVNGFNHLAYYSPPSNSTPKILTRGDWEVVSSPVAFDYKKNLVYFISTQDSSIERQLYSINLVNKDMKKYTNGEGWFSVSFSAGARYLSLSYRGPNIPYQKLIDLYTDKSTILEDNSLLKSVLKDYNLPQINYGEVDINTTTVNYIERLPPNFDATKKYPILFFVYGGPNSQLVTKAFSLSFPEIVASQLDAIVVTVDGRGTGFKGRQFRSMVRDNLGYYEVIDQIAAAKHWSSKPFVDEHNVAMFGWSYGGYMTLKTLEADAGETFKYGMSVAPVTNWKFYDSIYTERYMHTPQNNPEGYANSSVHNFTSLSQVPRFLLMHGTGDDNVHLQNSLQFLDHANLAGLENYDLHFFPDSDHAIRYHNAGVIVYDKLLSWLRSAFRGDFLRL